MNVQQKKNGAAWRRSGIGAAWALCLLATQLQAGGTLGAGGEAVLAPEPLAESEAGWVYEPGEGMRWTSAQGDVSVKWGGRLHMDWTFHSADDEIVDTFGEFPDGVRFRRARFFAEGTLYEKLGIKLQLDFAGGSAQFRDAYVRLKEVVAGLDLDVGQFKEPMGLEQLTSSNYISFIERSLPDVFTPSRNTGAMVAGTFGSNNVNWALGVFRMTDGFGDDQTGPDGQYNVTARVTGTPIYESDGSQVVHLGASYSVRKPDDAGMVRFRARPETSVGPRVVDVTVAAEDYQVAGVEAAWVTDQLSLQGEYFMASVDASAGEDPDFAGWYVMASWFLTGERRNYRPKGGTFGRVKPKANWGQGGGGAWEALARYSSIDLDDGGFEGGQLDDITVGVNWYLNPNARIMLNYIRGDVEATSASLSGDTEALLVRFQIDF